jgi:tetratricopeptide (TPR) repeat protein
MPLAHYNLGNAYSQAGRGPEAIAQYEQALRIRPEYTEAHVNLGTALQQAGRIKEAIAQYEQALALQPDLPEAHYDLGYAFSQAGQSQDAIGQLEQAIRFRPSYAEPRIYLAWLLATLPQAQGGDPGRAVTLAQQACDLTGNRVPAYLDILSVAESAAGRSDDAVVTGQKALDLARSLGQAQLAGQIEARLQSYRASHGP